VAIELQG
jgi:hypothetical protein